MIRRLKGPEFPGRFREKQGQSVATDPLGTNDGEVARPAHLHPENCNDVPNLAPQVAA